MTTWNPHAWRRTLSPKEKEILIQIGNEITDIMSSISETEEIYLDVSKFSELFHKAEELTERAAINESAKDFNVLGFKSQVFAGNGNACKKIADLIIKFLMDKLKDKIVNIDLISGVENTPAKYAVNHIDAINIVIEYKIKKIFDYEYSILDKLISILKNTKCVDGLELNMWESNLVAFDENFFILDKSYLSLMIRNKDLNNFQAKMLKNILITVKNTLDFYGFKLVKSENKENTDAWIYYSIILADDLTINPKDIIAEVEVYKKQLGEYYATSTYT